VVNRWAGVKRHGSPLPAPSFPFSPGRPDAAGWERPISLTAVPTAHRALRTEGSARLPRARPG